MALQGWKKPLKADPTDWLLEPDKSRPAMALPRVARILYK
jgi:hypothetical protein